MGWKDVSTESSGNTAKMDFVTFKENANTIIRVIDEEPYSRWTHWMPQYKRSVTCIGKGCPICDVVQKAKANKETAKYNQSKRHALRVINRNTNNIEILEQGRNFFSQLVDFHNEIGDIRNYDIKVIRKGTDKDTTYTLIPLPQKALSDEDNALIATNEFKLSEYFKAPTMEQLLMMLEGLPIEQIFVAEDQEPANEGE